MPTSPPMPLYVDLDGTLIRGDTMQQAFLMLLRRRPLAAIRAAWLLARGDRPTAKRLIAKYVQVNPEFFPWRQPVLDYVRQAKAEGRRVVLATGTWQAYADVVAATHPGLFDAVYGSDDSTNLIGPNKLARMRIDAGDQPFEYLGDSHADVCIFNECAVAGWVGTKRLKYVATDATRLHRLSTDRNDRPLDILRLMRPLQWTKNLLVFLPLLASHHWHDRHLIWLSTLALIALCLVASATYIANDLLDIDIDQAHPKNRRRPIATGEVTAARAAIVGGVCFVAGLFLASLANGQTALLILLYAALSIAYTLWQKRQLLVDVFALAARYAIRPVIGGAATGIVLSEWLAFFHFK